MSKHHSSIGLLAVLTLWLAVPVRGQELIDNGSFDGGAEGWREDVVGVEDVQSEWLAQGGRDGTGCIHIHSSSSRNECWRWRYVIKKIPASKALRISGWVRGRHVARLAAVCVQGWMADRSPTDDFATTATANRLSGDFDWTRVETDFLPSPQTKQAHILIFIAGQGEAWFDDISAVPVEQTEARVGGGQPAPGLFEARGAYKLTGSSRTPRPTFLLPLPISYREQVPLTYEISADPAEMLASVRIFRDEPHNYVAEVVLKPLDAGDTVELEWRSIVLCGPRSFDDLPQAAPLPDEWPADVHPWLRNTRCVQAEDKRIKKVAGEIRGDSDDALEIISATLVRTREIFASQKGRCTNLDAVQALEKKGSCTSCANLVAALLRASNIPARILAGYPTGGSPLQTHYIVEAYVPTYGWYPIESTMLRAPWPPYRQVEVAIIPPEYEDRSERRAFVAGGVPFLSLTERPAGGSSFMMTGTVDATRSCDHVAKVWRPFPPDIPTADWDRAIKKAKTRWQAWLASSPALDAHHHLTTPLTADAIRAKDPSELTRLLEQE